MAPSQNRVHAISKRPNRNFRIIKTGEARHFDVMAQLWNNKHEEYVERIAEEMKEAISHGFYLKCDMYFCFNRSRIFTKKNEPKRLDENNFIKPALDGLSKALKIDDTMFFAHHIEKTETEGEEHIVICIDPWRYRKRSEIIEELHEKIGSV